ncbi:MAG: hypothetical protein IH846_01830 [Acidobacteria bacterium]|nr:hypothetical protein [Acidobacteriota bacterium]
MKTDVFFGAILAAILVVSPALSQEAAQSSEEEASSSAETQQENAPAASQSSGIRQRRDPFRAIVVKKAEAEIPAQLPPGKAGLVIGQLQVQGIARSIDGTWIAVVDNNTNRAYFLREGDKLYNGTVSAISPDHVVFMEETTDARGQKSTREVVKRLPED